MHDGRPVSGPVRMRLQPPADCAFVPLVGMALVPTPPSYPPADLDDPDAVLTVQERPEEPGTIVPRATWRFGRDEHGAFVADGSAVWLEGGFRGGLIYDVVYRTERCPVVGTGLLAIRDAVSWLRWGNESDGNPLAGRVEVVCATGASQSGRLLRQFLFEGMNVDEEGRQVFDGVHAHIAGRAAWRVQRALRAAGRDLARHRGSPALLDRRDPRAPTRTRWKPEDDRHQQRRRVLARRCVARAR